MERVKLTDEEIQKQLGIKRTNNSGVKSLAPIRNYKSSRSEKSPLAQPAGSAPKYGVGMQLPTANNKLPSTYAKKSQPQPLPYAGKVSANLPQYSATLPKITSKVPVLPYYQEPGISSDTWKKQAEQLKQDVTQQQKTVRPWHNTSPTMQTASYMKTPQAFQKDGSAMSIEKPASITANEQRLADLKSSLSNAQNQGYLTDYSEQWRAIESRDDAEDVKAKLARMASMKNSIGTDMGQNIASMNEYQRLRGELESKGINAEGVADWLRRNSNVMEAYYQQQRDAVRADAHPIIESLKTVPQSLYGGTGALAGMTQSAMNSRTGEYRPIDTMGDAFDVARARQTVRGTVGEKVAQAVYEGTGSQTLANAANFLYGTAMSGLDSAFIAALGGGATAAIGATGGTAAINGAASIILGSNAASETMMDVVNRGGSTDQAVAAGILSGAAETIFEKVSIDGLISKFKSGEKGFRAFLKNATLQGVSEASEEMATEIANVIADYYVNGGLSEIEQMRQSGMSDVEIANEIAKRVGVAGAGGFLMGFGGGGMATVMNSTTTSLRERRAIKAFEELTGAKVDTREYLGRANSFYDEDGNVVLGGDSYLRVHNALAHEGGHLLKQKDRASWEGILKIASNNLTAEQRAVFEEKLARSGYDVTNEELVQEEMVSLYLQQCMSDISTFENLVGIDRTLAQKIVDFLDDIVRKVTHQNSYGINLEYYSLRDKLGDLTGAEETIAAMKQALAVVKSVDPQANADYIASLPKQTVTKTAQPSVQAPASIVGQLAGQNISRSQIEAILDDPASLAEMKAAGVDLTGTNSQRRQAVKDFVARYRYTVAAAEEQRLTDLWNQYNNATGPADDLSRQIDEQQARTASAVGSAVNEFVGQETQRLNDLKQQYNDAINPNDINALSRQIDERQRRIDTAQGIASVQDISRQHWNAEQRRHSVSDVENFATDTGIPSYDTLMNEVGKRYSLKSMSYDLDDGQMQRDLVASGVFTEEEAQEFIYNVNALMDKIMKKSHFLDMNEADNKEDRTFKAYKPNSDPLYQVSLDFSTLCKKRIITQAIIERLNVAYGKALDGNTQFAIAEKLRQLQSEYDGLQVACAICYVEAARLKSPNVINQFLGDRRSALVTQYAKDSAENRVAAKAAADAIKMSVGLDGKASKNDLKAIGGSALANAATNASKAVRDSYKPTPEQEATIRRAEAMDAAMFLTADGLTRLSKEEPEIYKAFTSKVRSATRSKALEGHVAYYYGDSASEVSDTLIEAMNKENGLRHQSWSDFELVHLLDEITAITEMSIRGAKMHTYTKVPEMVTVVGDTGMMINLSLIPEGHTGMDENGNLIFSSTEGMDINTARELRNRYGTTAGTICIGINDLQIEKLLAADDIDYVIPYHISGLTKHLRKIAGINQWVNYTASQNETKLQGLPKAGDTNWHKKPNFSDWFTPEIYNQNKPGIEIMREAAENYKRICADRGLKPKFYDKFGQNPNYWKLLVDRKMIDDKGNIIIQQAVKPNFDWDAIGKMVEQAEDPHMEDLIDTLAGEITKSMESGEIDAIAKNSQAVKKAQQMMDKLDAEDYLAANPTEGLSTNQKFSMKADPLYYLERQSNYKPVSKFATTAPGNPAHPALPYNPNAPKPLPKNPAQGKFGGNTVGAAQPNPGSYANLQTQYGVVDPGENPARMIDMPKKDANGQVNSLFARTVAESESMPDSMVPEWEEAVASGEFSHVVASDKSAMAYAERQLSQGWDNAMTQWKAVVNGERTANKNDIALGQLLLANAMKSGDTKTAMKLTAELCAEATRAGQNIQAMRLLKKMTPEGQLYYLQKTVNNLNSDFEGRKGFEGIKIDEGMAERLGKATTREEMNAIVDEIKQDIAAQTPVTWYDKWNAWRYLSMLGNPTTHIRNFFGNALFAPVVSAKNRIAQVIESAFKNTPYLPYATKAVVNKNTTEGRALLEFAASDYDNVAPEIQGVGKYSEKDQVLSERQVLPGIIGKAAEANANLLDAEDMLFSKSRYRNSLASYLKANNITVEQAKADPKVLEQARRYAINEAQKATYRDASYLASILNRAKRNLANTANNTQNKMGKRLGARAVEIGMEGLMPFTKTPINILKRGVEYSPAGLLKGLTYDLYQVKHGNMTAAEAIDGIAAGLTGSALVALGWFMSSMGWVTGGPDEDDRRDRYESMLGRQDYALNIDGKSYTIDWLAPEALPYFVGVALQENRGDDATFLERFLGTISNIAEPMIEMSMLEGVNSSLEAVKYSEGFPLGDFLGNLATSYAGQGVPTIGGKVARTIDETSRQTYYDPNKTGIVKSADVFRQKVQSKIPFAANALPERVDLWGRTEKNTGGNIVGRFFYNMLSPGYLENKNVTKVDNELLRLAEATSDSNVYPDTADKTFKVNGESVKLDSKQYTQFAKTKGQTAFEILDAAVDSSTYKKMTDAEKADFVKDVYEYANAKAKAEISDYQLDGKNAKIAQAEQKGIKPAQYLTITGGYDKDGNGSITQEEVKSVLDKTNLTMAQKAYMWKLQNKSWKTNPYE